MDWNAPELLNGLYIAVAIMLIIVLYHVLFIVVDARKIVRRVETITDELESVLLKPLSMTDKALEWVMGKLEDGKKGHHKHHHEE